MVESVRGSHDSHGAVEPVSSGEATALLRECTAAAARVRMDVIGEHRRGGVDDLEHALVEISAWSHRGVQGVDPVLLALASAALEDLLGTAGHQLDETLVLRIGAALADLAAAGTDPRYQRAA